MAGFHQAVAAGETGAMFAIAWMHYQGSGIPQNERLGYQWFQKAYLTWGPLPPWKRYAEFVKATVYLPRSVKDLPEGIIEDFRRVDDLAVEKPDERAATADRIERGDGFFPDPQTACLWRASAAWGSLRARLALAVQLHEGRGIPRHLDLSAKHYYLAALEGDAGAMVRLGEILVSGGEGIAADPRGAIKLFSRAEAAGLATAAAMRTAIERLGEEKAEAVRRDAMDGPLPAPRLRDGKHAAECK